MALLTDKELMEERDKLIGEFQILEGPYSETRTPMLVALRLARVAVDALCVVSEAMASMAAEPREEEEEN